jgi:AsmA protein
MRRAAGWASVAALAAIAAGFTRWPLSPAWVAKDLNAAFGASPTLIWTAPRAVTFSALPWPNLRIVEARLDDRLGVNLISAPEARLDLSLGGLLVGRVIPNRASLAAPTMALDLDRSPFTANGSLTDAAAAASSLAPLRSLSLADGVLRIVSKARGLDGLVENVQGRLDGLVPGERLSVNLSVVWRGVPVKIFGALADPVLAANGQPSAFSAAFASPVVDLGFNGLLTGGRRRSVAGDFYASSPSLTALARFLGVMRPSFLAADDVAMSGKVKATPTVITLDDAALTSAGQTIRGALHIAGLEGRPSVSSTLDADKIAVSALFGPPAPLFGPNGEWNRRSFSLAPPSNFDLDLRLSARRLDAYGLDLADAAVSAILKNGVLSASLVDASAYGGRLQSEIRLACLEQNLQLAARAKLSDADFGAIFPAFGWPGPTGKGTVELTVQTAGSSPALAIAALGGSAQLKLEHGAVAGVNLEEALRRSQRRPIDVVRDTRVGGTAFDRLSLELAVGNGVAHVVNGDLDAQGVAASLQGAIDLGAQRFNLRVNALQTGAAGAESKDAAHLSFDIEGPWRQPTVRAVAADGRETIADPPTAPAQ